MDGYARKYVRDEGCRCKCHRGNSSVIYIYGWDMGHVWETGVVHTGFGGENSVKENTWKT